MKQRQKIVPMAYGNVLDVGGGCNLNCNIPELICDGVIKINNLETMYIPGFKLANYNLWRVARPR